jgi:hypothetical protein
MMFPCGIVSMADETTAEVILIDDENAVSSIINVANWAGTVETNIVKVGNQSLKSKSDGNFKVEKETCKCCINNLRVVISINGGIYCGKDTFNRKRTFRPCVVMALAGRLF